MSTATGYRNRILEYADEHGHDISKGKAMKLAIVLHRRGERMHDENLERIFTHSDPTPPAAFKRIHAKAELAKRGVVLA
ncbi:hypothetical protein [Micrococcus sp. TA1]|uniref:hypothetical protein n=1 Tax=Micrococcus sp. TA1 TaxID=681627 RepID=UPI001621803A|nr:hypothetical protein [Micrococcus sp. TA1]MBB5748588.1 hypothetical protein [Micrococcus sp. TA1]